MKMKKFWIFLWTFCGFIQFVILESISDVRSSSETKELFSSSDPDNSAIFTATKSLAEYEKNRNSLRTSNFGFSNSLSSSDWVESVSVINNSLVLTKHNVTSVTSLKRQPTSTSNSEPETSITEIDASEINNPPLSPSPVFWITFDPLGQDISTISFKRRLQTELAALVTDVLRTDRRTRREINDSVTIEVEEIKSDGPNKGEATFVIKQNGKPVSAELAGEILGRLTSEELDQYLDVKVLEPLTLGTTSSSYEASFNITSTVFENSITESSISNRETSSSSVAVSSEMLLEKTSMFDETPKISSETKSDSILQSVADTKVTTDITVFSNTSTRITKTLLESQIMISPSSKTAHIITSLDLSISSLFIMENSQNYDIRHSTIESMYIDQIHITQTLSESPMDQSVSQQTQSLYQRPLNTSVISINPSPVLQTSEIQDQSRSVINSITPSLIETRASDVPNDPVIDSSSVSSSSSSDNPSVLRDNHASDNISDSMHSISTHDVVSNSVINEQDDSAMNVGTLVVHDQSVERTQQSSIATATSSIVIQPSSILDYSEQNNDISSFYTQNAMPVFSADVVEISEESSLMSSNISPSETLLDNSQQHNKISSFYTQTAMPVFSMDVVKIPEQSSSLNSTISPTQKLLVNSDQNTETSTIVTEYMMPVFSADVVEISEESSSMSSTISPTTTLLETTVVVESTTSSLASFIQALKSSDVLLEFSEMVQQPSEEVQISSEVVQPSSEVVQSSSEVVQPSSEVVQSSIEVVQPSSEVVQSSSEDVQQSSEVTQPSSEVVQPSSEEEQPSSAVVQPSSEVVHSSSEVVHSSSEVVLPSSEQMQPSSEKVQPSSEAIQPSSEELQPSSEEVHSSSEVVQSSSEEVQPSSEELHPSSKEVQPSSEEVQPSSEVVQLSSQEVKPSSEKVQPSSEAIQPSSEQMQPSSEKVQPSSEAIQPSSEELQPSSEKVQSFTDAVQPSSDAVKPSSENEQPSSQEEQSSSEVIQISSEVVQPSSEEVQPSSKMIQPSSEMIQPSSEIMQPSSEVIQISSVLVQPSSEEVRPSSEIVQPSSEVIQASSVIVQPSSEEVRLSSEEEQSLSEVVQPSSEDVQLSSEVKQPSSDVIQPSSEEVQSSSEVVQSSSEEVQPSSEELQQPSEVVQSSSEEVQPSSEAVQSSSEVARQSMEVAQQSSEVVQLSNEVVQLSSVVAQQSSELVQPSSEVAQPSNEAVQPSSEMVQPSSQEVQPSNVKVQPSNELVQPSSEQMQPSREEEQTTSEGVQPSSAEVQSSSEAVQPSNEEVQPSSEVIQTSNEVVKSSIEVVQPSSEAVQSSSEVAQPSNEAVQPSSEEVQPSNEAVQPSSEVVQPSNEAVQPSSEEVHSSSEDLQPSSEVIEPSSEGEHSSSGVALPSSEEVETSDEEVQPSSVDVQPSSVDVQPSSEELQPSSEELKPSSEEVQPSSLVIQTSSEAVQSSSDVVLPSSEEVQQSSQEIQPLQSSDEVVQSTEETISSNDNAFETSQGATPIFMETENISSETILLSDMENLTASTISQLPSDNISPSTVLPSVASLSYSDTSPVIMASSSYTEIQPSSSKISSIRIPSSSSDTTQSMATEINIDMSKYLLKFTIDPGGQDTGSQDFRDTLKLDLELLLETGDDKLKGSRRRRAVEPSIAVNIKSIQDISTGKTEVQFIVTRDNKPIPNDEILSILGQLSAEEIQQIMEFEIVEPITAVQPSSSTIVNSENNPDSTIRVTKSQGTSVTDAEDVESILVSTKSDITSHSISTTAVETAELSSVSTHSAINSSSFDVISISTPEVEESHRLTLSSSVTSLIVLSSPSSVIDTQDTISSSSTVYTSDVSVFETDLEVGSSLLESSMSSLSSPVNTLTVDESSSLAPSTVIDSALQDMIYSSTDDMSDVSVSIASLETGSSLLESSMSLSSTPTNTLTVDILASLAPSAVTVNTLQDIKFSSYMLNSSDDTSDVSVSIADLETGSSLLESSMSLSSPPAKTLIVGESSSLAPSAVTVNTLQDITFSSSMLNSPDDTSDVSVSRAATDTLDESPSWTLLDITSSSSDTSSIRTILETEISSLLSTTSLLPTITSSTLPDGSPSLRPSSNVENDLQILTSSVSPDLNPSVQESETKTVESMASISSLHSTNSTSSEIVSSLPTTDTISKSFIQSLEPSTPLAVSSIDHRSNESSAESQSTITSSMLPSTFKSEELSDRSAISHLESSMNTISASTTNIFIETTLKTSEQMDITSSISSFLTSVENEVLESISSLLDLETLLQTSSKSLEIPGSSSETPTLDTSLESSFSFPSKTQNATPVQETVKASTSIWNQESSPVSYDIDPTTILGSIPFNTISTQRRIETSRSVVVSTGSISSSLNLALQHSQNTLSLSSQFNTDNTEISSSQISVTPTLPDTSQRQTAQQEASTFVESLNAPLSNSIEESLTELITTPDVSYEDTIQIMATSLSSIVSEKSLDIGERDVLDISTIISQNESSEISPESLQSVSKEVTFSVLQTSLPGASLITTIIQSLPSMEPNASSLETINAPSTDSTSLYTASANIESNYMLNTVSSTDVVSGIMKSSDVIDPSPTFKSSYLESDDRISKISSVDNIASQSISPSASSTRILTSAPLENSKNSVSTSNLSYSDTTIISSQTLESSVNLGPTETSSTLLKESSVPIISPTAPQTTVEIAPSKSPFSSATLSTTVAPPDLSKYLVRMVFDPDGKDITSDEFKQQLSLNLLRAFKEALKKFQVQRRKRQASEPKVDVNIRESSVINDKEAEVSFYFTVDEIPIIAPKIEDVFASLTPAEMDQITGVHVLQPISSVNPITPITSKITNNNASSGILKSSTIGPEESQIFSDLNDQISRSLLQSTDTHLTASTILLSSNGKDEKESMSMPSTSVATPRNSILYSSDGIVVVVTDLSESSAVQYDLSSTSQIRELSVVQNDLSLSSQVTSQKVPTGSNDGTILENSAISVGNLTEDLPSTISTSDVEIPSSMQGDIATEIISEKNIRSSNGMDESDTSMQMTSKIVATTSTSFPSEQSIIDSFVTSIEYSLIAATDHSGSYLDSMTTMPIDGISTILDNLTSSTPDLSASARPSTEDLSTDLDIITSTMAINSLNETSRSSSDETARATITGVEENSTDSLIFQTINQSGIVNQTDITASESTFSFEISEYSTVSDSDLKSISDNVSETSIIEIGSSISRTLDMILNTVSATYLASVNDTIQSDAPQTATSTASFSIEPSFTELVNGSLPSSELQLESTSDMIDVTQTNVTLESFTDLFNASTISTTQWPEGMISSNESFADVTQTALDNATIEPSYTDMISDVSLLESPTSSLFSNDTYTSEVGQTEGVLANSTIELTFTELVDASTTSPPAIESSTDILFGNHTLNGKENTEMLSINVSLTSEVEQTETIANFTMESSAIYILSSTSPSPTLETEGTFDMSSYMDNYTADTAQSETVTVNSTIYPSFTDASMSPTLQDTSTLDTSSMNISLPFTITTSSSLLAFDSSPLAGELNSSTPVVEASTDLEINMTRSSDITSIDDSAMIPLSSTLTVGEIQESSILPSNDSSSIGSIGSSMSDFSYIDDHSTFDSSFTGITTSLANFDTYTAPVSMVDLNSSDITSIGMDTMISESLTIEPTISMDSSQDLLSPVSNETSATSSYFEIEPSIQTTIEPDNTMTQSDQGTVMFPSNATDIISSEILMPNATMPSSETSISQDLDSSSSVYFSFSNFSITSSVPETDVTASQADGSDLETTSSFLESTTTLLPTPTQPTPTTSSDIISISTITSSNASDSFEAITSKISEPTASSTSIAPADTLVPISPISAITETHNLSFPSTPVKPTSTFNPKPTVSSTSIIPTSSLNPKPTVSSTSIIPTSSLIPSSSITVTTKGPEDTSTSPPVYTPTEDDMMVLEVSVKLEKDIKDETFQRELETGLMTVFQEASQLGSRKKRSSGNVKFVFKRDVQNSQGVAVTKIERDPSKTQEVKSEFYLVENGEIVSAEAAVPIFNRFNNADKSAILGYSALGPVRSLKAGDPTQTTEPEDQTTVLFIVAIVLPCCLVLILIIILIKCYMTNACKNQSIMDYKRGESLEDHNLAVDMEKGDIISGRSSKNSQILPEEYSPRTDRKVPIRNRESPGTSMGNNNSMSKRQSVRENTNRKTVPQQHAERQTRVPSGQNVPVSPIDQPDIPMSEIPSPKRQSTDELSLHDEVFHATEVQTHERAPRHTRGTSNRDSTRKERTSRSSVGRDESPRKRKESKTRKSSRTNPKDNYYLTMKRNDPSFDGSEHTDASEEFTILVPKSQEKRHFEGHTNQIFFDSVVPATDISPTTRHPKGNRLEKQLKVIGSPKTKKKPRSQISSRVEFDPCFSPQCSIVEELEVDTPGSTYPTNNFGREYSDVDPYYHSGGVPSSHAMTSIRFDSETNPAPSDQIPINGQSFTQGREFTEYPTDTNPYYYGDSLRAGPNQPVHPIIQQPLQAVHINQQSMVPVGYSNQLLMSENIPTTSIAVGPDVSTVTAVTQTSDHEMIVTAEEDKKLARPIPYSDPEMKDMKTQTSRDVGAQMDKVEEISILPRTTTKSGPSITVEAEPTVQGSQPHQLPGEVPVSLLTKNQYPVPTPRKPRSPIPNQTRSMYHVPNAQDLLKNIDPSSVPQQYFQNEPHLHPYPGHHQHLPSFYPNPMEMQQTRLTGPNGVPQHPDFRYTGDYMSPYPPVSLNNNSHQPDRMNTSLYSQPVVHSRMARFNPYEELQPEPPAVRYQLVPEPNYLVQPEFPPLDAGIQPPEGEVLTFYQEPFRQETDNPDSQSSPTRYRQTPPLYTSEYDKDGEENEDIVQLLQAAETGNLKDVIKYSNKLEDVNASNKNGLTALHVASKSGHVNIVDTLLERGANIHAVTKKGNTALSMASLEGHLEVVKLLIANFAKVNTQSQEGFTPLYMASQEGHEEIVCYLLNHGANQHIPTKNGFTPLAVALQQGHEPVVSLLIEQGSKGKIHLPTHHESEDDRSSSQRPKSLKKRQQQDVRESSPRQRKHDSPGSKKEYESNQQSSTHGNSSRKKHSKKSRHRDSDNSEKSSPRRSKGDNSQSKNRSESSSRSRSRETTPVKKDRNEKSRHRDSDNSEKSSPRRSKGDNSQNKTRSESSSRSRSRETTPVKKDRREKSSRRNDRKKEETYQTSAFPKVGRSDLNDDLSDRSSPRQLTDDDKYEQSTRRKEKISPRSDTSSRNSTPRKTYSDSEDGDRSQYSDKNDSDKNNSDKNNSDNEDQYSEESFYSDSENGSSKPSTPRQEKPDKEGRKSRVSKTQKGDNSDEESVGDVSDGSTVASSRQDDSQRSPSGSNSKRHSENGDGDSSHGDSQSERSHSDVEDDDNANNKKPKPERNRYYNEDVSPRSRNIHFEDEIPIESNQFSDRSKISTKSTRKDPQDLYSQIKSEMLKSYKDLNRKTAKNMPDRVENLTDDQLLLLYEFHRRRLLFQGRQEASVKAKVMFNETFLTEEIRRLKKQQQDAKKKMKEILDDAFPTTCVEKY